MYVRQYSTKGGNAVGIQRRAYSKQWLSIYSCMVVVAAFSLIYYLSWASERSQYLQRAKRLLTTTNNKVNQDSQIKQDLSEDIENTQSYDSKKIIELEHTLNPPPANVQNPKVALLFLTRGKMVTEPVWTQFFKLAGEVQLAADPPTQYVGFQQENLEGYLDQELYPEQQVDWEEFHRGCWEHPNTTQLVTYTDPRKRPRPTRTEQLLERIEYREMPDVIDQQELYSVYVHTKHDFEGYPSSSIFQGRVVEGLVETAFGEHSLVEAEKVLLAAALKDPYNVVFVLLSDSCVPIYHPTVVYAQLMSEQVSRVDGCTIGKEKYRWSDLMSTEYFSYSQFRKSSQWWSLRRPHATLIVADKHIEPIMKTYCSTKLWCDDPRVAYVCVSDESYVPSVLAAYGLDNETNCQAKLTAADWRGMNWHPREFKTSSINKRLIQYLRTDVCQQQQQQSQVSRLFERRTSSEDVTNKVDWNTFKPMNYNCPLFARKFPTNSSVAGLLKISQGCEGLQLNHACIFGPFSVFQL